MKLFVTILEPTVERAIEAMRAIALDHDGIEVRAEQFPRLDLQAIRAATAKPIILTRRGLPFDGSIAGKAIAAGVDLVDVEFDLPGVAPLPSAANVWPKPAAEGSGATLEFVRGHGDRVVLSFHDFDGIPDLEQLLRDMRATGAKHVKIAVTPKTFAENERLLDLLKAKLDNDTTIIGMGERGLYSRVLAPFRGSAILFVGPAADRAAAPGQIDLERALAIYGKHRESLSADRVFAIAGNPAGHSLSPTIHNPLFRERGVPAAYTIASFDSFDEIADAFVRGEPCGLSVTRPFKQPAYAFAQRQGAEIGVNAAECEAVNTLVNLRGRIIADNTDVDGFASIVGQVCGRDRKSVAIIGAGGTARAAMVALHREAMDVTIYNRTEAAARALASRFGARVEPLSALAHFDGQVVIDTTPPGSDLPLRPHANLTVIEAAYGSPALIARQQAFRRAGVTLFDGLDLLQGQAIRQNALFMKVFE